MAKSKKWDKSHFPVRDIHVAEQNDKLYDRFGIANADDYALAKSISDKGVQNA